MSHRPKPPDSVYFPVVPMLDMAFQLLAFFILTFRPPGLETRIDLDLPVGAVAMPAPTSTGATAPRSRPAPRDGLEIDLILRVEGDPETGALRVLRVDDRTLTDMAEVDALLRERVAERAGSPLHVALLADDHLAYAHAARLLGICSEAGVAAVRLVAPERERADEEKPAP